MPSGGTLSPERDALIRLEAELHRGTIDWPCPHPPVHDPMEAWAALGRPHVLWISVRDSAAGVLLERAWVTGDGEVGTDLIRAPLGHALPDSPPCELAAALIPEALIDSLLGGGIQDDLVVVAPEGVRSIAWPMLPLADHGNERLNALAAVTLLPSLSWGVHLKLRSTPRLRDRHRELAKGRSHHSDGPAVVAYLHPGLGLDQVALLIASPHNTAVRVPELAALGDALTKDRPWMALVTAHGAFTDDGSVDLRDHRGALVPPDLLLTWPVPPVALIVGCRTAASNVTAPLHLAEAALIAGASHVVAATGRTTDALVDQALARVLRLLLPEGSRSTSMGPSQALQSALQQIDRAWPHPDTDLTAWPLVHIGLPGSAER